MNWNVNRDCGKAVEKYSEYSGSANYLPSHLLLFCQSLPVCTGNGVLRPVLDHLLCTWLWGGTMLKLSTIVN